MSPFHEPIRETWLNGVLQCPICKGSGGGTETNEGVTVWVPCDCQDDRPIACPVCLDDGEVLDGDTRRPCARCLVANEPDYDDKDDAVTECPF